MVSEQAITALVLGLISAASLPMGALTILFWRPGPRMTAFLMAFGGGTLLAAITIDLVSESVHRGQFVPLAIGCVLGGVLFTVLNRALNSQGGFLRKPATAVAYIRDRNVRRYKALLKKLAAIPLFGRIPPEEIRLLVPYIHSQVFSPGGQICRQGEKGSSLFIIEKGRVDIIDEKGGRSIDTLGAGDVLGEIALITGETRTATARALEETRAWVIDRDEFGMVMRSTPVLAAVLRDLAANRLVRLKSLATIDPEKADEWARIASKNIDEKFMLPTETEIREAAEEKGGAPLAIWLGILLDGIPESLVIGAISVQATMSMSLLAGLFISNFPEALTSSLGMRGQGKSMGRILLMWGSLTLISGAGAFIGNLAFAQAPAFLFHLLEGMTVGATLTVIAETMLPEAFQKGGAITGLSTLFGFLTAISFKVLDKYIQ